MDGPLGHGFVKALAVPVDLRFGPAGAVRLMASGGCTTAGSDRLELAGVLLGQERLRTRAQHAATLFDADAGGRLYGGMQTPLAVGGRPDIRTASGMDSDCQHAPPRRAAAPLTTKKP